MKKILVCLLAALLALSCFSACADTVIGASNDGSTGAGGFDEAITLNGDSVKYAGGGVSINKEKLTDQNKPLTQDDLIGGKYILAQRGKKNYFLITVK